MAKFCKILILTLTINQIFSMFPTLHNSNDETDTLKYAIKFLSNQLEKWNTILLTILDPKLSYISSTIGKVDSNIHNLQERAHVWDTFQLHITAWNDQLASLDRKSDIINSGLEKLILLEAKINKILTMEHKVNNIAKKFDELQSGKIYGHGLFGEFTNKGLLTTMKMVERKLDKVLSQRNIKMSNYNNNTNEKFNVTIKCNFPKKIEDIINDIASKIDLIFDKFMEKYEREYEYEGSGEINEDLIIDKNLQKKKSFKQCRSNIIDEELLSRLITIENILQLIFDKDHFYFKKTSQQNNITHNLIINKNTNIINEINNMMENLKIYYEKYLIINVNKNDIKYAKLCEDLIILDKKGGIYNLNNNDRGFCDIRNDGIWTVIQRRDNYPVIQNFSLDWNSYKRGFGNLSKDFWWGNDRISKLSKNKSLILRIELEDFNGNFAWAEYDRFIVLNENNNYQLIIDDYKGNSSDSLLNHNGSYFSTFDHRNDQNSNCCSCAQSHEGGWWFNSCFKSNLNGVYYKKQVNQEDEFKGIIWKQWLGNYSLKRTLMMIKSKNTSTEHH